MVENFSPVIFLYGMAIVLAVSKAITMAIWRVLPKARPPLREEVLEAWTRRRVNSEATKEAVAQEPDRSTVAGSLSRADDDEKAPHSAASGPEQTPATQPASNVPTER